jgi:hypothetical protein
VLLLQADIIPVYNQMMRYCQQCGTLEPLHMFESNKRSCRDSLERRVKRPAQHEQKRERRKRRPASSFGPSSSNDGSNSNGSFQFAAAVADAAAAGNATALCDAMLDVNVNAASWNASLLAPATAMPDNSMWEATAATVAASWGSDWMEVPAPAAVPAAAVPAADMPAPTRTHNAAAMATADYAAPPVPAAVPAPVLAPVTSCPVTTMPWQQQQLQPLVTQFGNAPAGLNSPLGTSCSSSDSMDPAVLELEQFMLQELAAAGMLAMDSSSATRLPEPPVAIPAPAPMQQQQQQMSWQPAAHVPRQQQQQPARQQQQQPAQQQQQAPMLLPTTLQHQSSRLYPAAQQQQQWHSMAAPATAASQHHATVMCAAAPAAVRNAVPAGVAGMMPPMPAAPVMPAVCAAPVPAVAAPVRKPRCNAHVMAQLQDRLYALQSQMEDMQLMLGLLQNA